LLFTLPDNLPNITEILSDIGLSHREVALKNRGVGETRHLLRLEKMDYHMMKFEWDGDGDGDADADVELLKKKAAELLPLAIVTNDAPVVPDDRHKHKLGRVYVPGFVKSFEYTSASFGLPPPIGPLPIMLADPLDGCEPQTGAEGKMLVVTRGVCTFLQKSLAARSSKTALLVIVNSEDKLESVTTGYGIDKSIKNKDIETLHKFSVISTANTSLAPLQYALNVSTEPLMGHVVPLKCGKLGKCAPSTEIEKSYQYEVSWGRIQISDKEEMGGPSFDFLTSNFGGLLPPGRLPLVASTSIVDACQPLDPLITGSTTGAALLVTRGNCPFDVKALNVQNAGGAIMVIEDPADRSLQRIGGSHPLDGMTGVPSIAVSFQCSEYIRQLTSANKKVFIHLEASNNSTGSEKWIEVSYTQWADARKDRLTQLEGMLKKYEADSPDIGAWLKRRVAEVEKSLDKEL